MNIGVEMKQELDLIESSKNTETNLIKSKDRNLHFNHV